MSENIFLIREELTNLQFFPQEIHRLVEGFCKKKNLKFIESKLPHELTSS